MIIFVLVLLLYLLVLIKELMVNNYIIVLLMVSELDILNLLFYCLLVYISFDKRMIIWYGFYVIIVIVVISVFI